jgi:hypothetical protein
VAIGVVLGAVLVAIIVLGISAARALESAKSSMETARALIESDISDKGRFLSSGGRQELAADLQTVNGYVRTASATIHGSFGLRLLGSLPYLSDQRNGVLQLVDDAGTTATTGMALLQRADQLIGQSRGTSVSLPALASFQDAVERAHATVIRLDRPVGDLLGPLATARHQFDTQVRKIAGDLSRGEQALSYLRPFLGADGPRTYLIAGENNAEMRDQGDVLSLATMSAQGGTFSVQSVGSVDTLEPTQSVTVPIPGTTRLVFGDEQPTLLWQSVNASADFPTSARIMQAMFAQVEGVHVDGVVAVDVPALASLLRLSGPVTVAGISGVITDANVSDVLLHRLYEQYPANSEQAGRHDDISAVATAVVHQMKAEHIDLASLASALASDVAGRHLLIWDQTPAYEKTIRTMGASGSLSTTDADRTFHVDVENSTATKLDYYVTSSVSYRVQITATGEALVNTTVTVSNQTPSGLGPSYQTGPDNIRSFVPGQYVGRVLIWSPRGAEAPNAVEESGLDLREIQVSVLPQQSQTVSFATVIPHAVVGDAFSLRFVPQPRLVPESLRISLSASGWTVRAAPRVAGLLATTKVYTWTLAH